VVAIEARAGDATSRREVAGRARRAVRMTSQRRACGAQPCPGGSMLDRVQVNDSTIPSDPLAPVPAGCRLVVVTGDAVGTSRALVPGRHVVGRSPQADLTVAATELSRFHFEVIVDDRSITVRDLGSANGIVVNGIRVGHAVVRPGATILAGGVQVSILPPDADDDDDVSPRVELAGLVGKSRAMRRLCAQLSRIATSTATVLISGESGAGKEVVAEAIHRLSPRAARPFVVCDLTTVGRDTLESELFGHVRGAFTGAVADRPGLLRTADGGSVLLDEIGELSPEAQTKLLRVVERREVRAVGGSRAVALDLRLIAASLRPLAEMARAGKFRPDLLHRLSVLTLAVPPLRDRADDLGPLARHLLGRLDPGRTWLVTGEAEALLAAYPWPGNVRELRNVLERVVVRASAPVLDVPALVAHGGVAAPRALPAGPLPFHLAKELVNDQWERAYLVQLLARAEGNLTRAAALAGVARAHVYRLLHKHGLGGIRVDANVA
jgi:DNA-binding NtrC family response regulator